MVDAVEDVERDREGLERERNGVFFLVTDEVEEESEGMWGGKGHGECRAVLIEV